MKKLVVILAVCGSFFIGCSSQENAKDAEQEKVIQQADSMAGVMEDAVQEIKESEAELDEALKGLEVENEE